MNKFLLSGGNYTAKFQFPFNAVIFAAVAWLLVISIDRVELGLSRVNHLAVPVTYLLDFSSGDAPYEKSKFIDHLLYYEAIYRFNPTTPLPDVYGVLGFCHFYMGNMEKAQHFLEKAVSQNGDYFWNRHNLAILYYLSGKYELAVRHAQAAVSAKEGFIGQVIKASPVLRMADNLLRYNRQDDDGVGLDIKRVYRGKEQMRSILVLGLTQLGQWQEVVRRCFQAFDELKMENWFYNYFLGVAYLKQQMHNQALYYFLRVIGQQPYFEPAYEGIKEAATKIQEADSPAIQAILSRAPAPQDGFTIEDYFEHHPLKLYVY